MYADGPPLFYLKKPVQNKDYRCLIGLINCKGILGLIQLRVSEHFFYAIMSLSEIIVRCNFLNRFLFKNVLKYFIYFNINILKLSEKIYKKYQLNIFFIKRFFKIKTLKAHRKQENGQRENGSV